MNLPNVDESQSAGAAGMFWLARPLACGGKNVLGGLDPARLRDSDLPNICLRMHVILESIEMPRCEGRLLPREIFDQIDTLEDELRHGGRPHLPEWIALISEFGRYYSLDGQGVIDVDASIFHEVVAQSSVFKPTAVS